MKLLFDQNLSPKLVNRLADIFPGSSHVMSLGLDCARDEVVWDYARDHDYVIVTKDADYNQMGVLHRFSSQDPVAIARKLRDGTGGNSTEGQLR